MEDILNYITLENLLQVAYMIFYVFATYFIVVWVAMVVWVAKDIISRSDSFIFQIIAIILVIIFNFFGLLIYILLRPANTLNEKYADDSELDEFFFRNIFCNTCKRDITSDFSFCPYCGDNLKRKCKVCKEFYDDNFDFCPYCGEYHNKRKSVIHRKSITKKNTHHGKKNIFVEKTRIKKKKEEDKKENSDF